MKLSIIYLIFITFTIPILAQVQNPSFEIDGNGSLEGWSNICNLGQLAADAAPNGGAWSLGLMPGNTQGCFPSYYYQTFPTVMDGELFLLSAWSKNLDAMPCGIYFAKVTEQNEIVLLDGDTTSAQIWTPLNIERIVTLEQGDTAAIVLTSGLVGGPAGGQLSCLFDEVYFEKYNSTDELFMNSITVFPNPTNGSIQLQSENELTQTIHLVIINPMGQIVFKEKCSANEEKNLTALNEGIYFYYLESANKKSRSEKLILSK